jgi:hypothetical protein
MTQRIQSRAPSHEVPGAPGIRSAPGGAIKRAWTWGYAAICLLALVAAGAIARGRVAKEELRIAAVAIDPTRVFEDICAASGDVEAAETIKAETAQP